MSRVRSLLAVTALLVGAALLAIGWLAPGPPRITIRWTTDTTEPVRVDAERTLRLTSPVRGDGRFWSYALLDTSPEHIQQIVDHPAVEDHANIGPGNTLRPDAPRVQAWFQTRYGRGPVKWIEAWWWLVGPALCLAAVAAARPVLRAWVRAADPRVAAVLIVAAAVRVWLILGGGQYYWPDEDRYRGAAVLLAALGGNADARADVLREPASLLLKVIGTVPAAIEALTGGNPHVPALFFGACSVISIWLLARIAGRLGASRDERFLVAVLAAGSTTLFYMSRHLLSYDLALMLGLVGMDVGMRRPATASGSMLTGVWAVAAFLAYAGAWPFAAAVCAMHVVDAASLRDAIRRTALVVAGVMPWIGALIVGYHAAGLSWVTLLGGFARNVSQGDFAEGWALPVAYLWHAEHLLLIGWLAALAWSLWRFRESRQSRLTRAALIGVICVYASLALSSTILHRFVVYGRLSRPLVPMLCLITAGVIGSGLRQLPDARRRVLLVSIVVGVTLQAAFNFRVPLQQEYPNDFIARIAREYPAARFVNARHLYPGPEAVAIPPGYREVALSLHPLEYLPYQYEGFTPAERRVLRANDIRMKAFVPQ